MGEDVAGCGAGSVVVVGEGAAGCSEALGALSEGLSSKGTRTFYSVFSTVFLLCLSCCLLLV